MSNDCFRLFWEKGEQAREIGQREAAVECYRVAFAFLGLDLNEFQQQNDRNLGNGSSTNYEQRLVEIWKGQNKL